MAAPTSEPVKLPPGPALPKAALSLAFFTARGRALSALAARHGDTFTVDLPIFGPTVVDGDPTMVRELSAAGSDLVARASNLGTVRGPCSGLGAPLSTSYASYSHPWCRWHR